MYFNTLGCGVAVSHIDLSLLALEDYLRVLTLSLDDDLLFGCRRECDRVFAGVQVAAVEAERQGGGGRPHMEEFAAVQRLDVRWKHHGGCVYSPSYA